MKKINLIIIVFCIGIISIFGINSKEYSISNISYTEGNSNLIGKEVSVRGIDEGTFHILSYDGEKVRLLAYFVLDGSYYRYNPKDDYSGVAVPYENSMLYQVIQEKTNLWKKLIESSGGKNNIYKVDAPTLDEIVAIGNLSSVNDEKYENGPWYTATASTPAWLLNDNDKFNYYSYLTKTVEKDAYGFDDSENGQHYYFDGIYVVGSDSINLWTVGYQTTYGNSIRPVLETSVYNLVSEDSEIKDYVESLNKKDEGLEQENKAQIVKVPSTGINASITFMVVGLAVIVIAGIVIWTLVKGKKK